MQFASFLALGALSLLVSALPNPGLGKISSRLSAGGCPTGAIVIAARGHNGDGQNNAGGTNYGLLDSTRKQVLKKIPGSVSYSVTYPNGSPDLIRSVPIGVAAAAQAVGDAVGSCPDARIILLGYSEGAMVMSNLICGTSSPNYKPTAPLNSIYRKNIAALVVYGDLTQTAGMSWDMGTCPVNGTRARTIPSACNPYAKRIHSYCDDGDLYCCTGGTSKGVHGSYAGKYNAQAVSFVSDMYNALWARQQRLRPSGARPPPGVPAPVAPTPEPTVPEPTAPEPTAAEPTATGSAPPAASTVAESTPVVATPDGATVVGETSAVGATSAAESKGLYRCRLERDS